MYHGAGMAAVRVAMTGCSEDHESQEVDPRVIMGDTASPRKIVVQAAAVLELDSRARATLLRTS